MYKTVLVLLLLATDWGAEQTLPPATNSASRILILDNSSMSLPTAKATLIVGPLICSNHVYVGAHFNLGRPAGQPYRPKIYRRISQFEFTPPAAARMIYRG